jgi:uncharacterized protein (DUF58 family)
MRAAFSTLTTRGRAFLAAGAASSACALLLGQKDLLRVGVLLLALPAITALVVGRARYTLSCSRELMPARVPAGKTSTVSLHLENPGRIPTGLMLLEDQVPYVLGSRPRFVIDQLRPKWRREMAYTVRSDVRGRYQLGPLTVKISDPFGFVELTRAFTARSTLIVTPVVHTLPQVPLSGDWSGTGDNRPRAFAAAGQEDVTVREYRLGDDLRRIHWRATAHSDELMVRREEQPHQSRATVLLDTRATSHRGTGPTSSFEYAVSATASAAAHLSDSGFMVRLMTDGLASDGTWHDRGISAPVEIELLLDSLAVIRPSSRREFGSQAAQEGAPGLVIAILGDVTPADIASLSRLRAGSTRALAVLLDVGAWAGHSAAAHQSLPQVESQAAALRRHSWSVVVAGPGDRLQTVWRDLGNTRAASRRLSVQTRLREAGPAA